MSKGRIFIISGPSGSGKSTVLKLVFERLDNYFFSVSATTRAPRPGEVHGREYYFISKEKFIDMIDGGEFLEYTQYAGNYYGTPLATIESHASEGTDVFLDVEIEGHKNIRKRIPEAISVFITPPSIEVLEQRLRKRSTETEDTIKRRLRRAKKEMALADTYDFVVVNDELETAVNELYTIILNERNKTDNNGKEC